MQPTKKEIKADLQLLAKYAITRIVGNIPRPQMRSAARLYATEAYRHLKGLPMLHDNTTRANQTVIDWIVREYKNYVSAVDANESARNDVGSPASRPTGGDREVSMRIITEDEG